MAQSSSIEMLVNFGLQKRPITIKEDDNVDTIQSNIYTTFGTVPSDSELTYQVQFYDAEWRTYIDLCSNSNALHKFRALFQMLLTSPSLPKTNPEWYLNLEKKRLLLHKRITHKTLGVTNTVQRGAPVVDLAEYPLGENQDDWEIDDTLFGTSPLLEANDDFSWFDEWLETAPSTVPNTSPLFETSNFERLFSQSDIDDDDGAADEGVPYPTADSTDNRTIADGDIDITDTESIVSTEPHNYNLRFEPDFDPSQRYQTESEAIKKPPNQSIGGCLLHASEQSSDDEEEKIYAQLKFEIPENERNLSWKSRLSVLTSADKDDNYYGHPSKEILDEECTQVSIDATRSQSTSVVKAQATFIKDLDVELSQEILQHGAYTIHMRVFNRTPLSKRQHTKLKQFSRFDRTTGTHNLVDTDSAEQHPQVTLFSLGLIHHNYHVAAMLLRKIK